MPIDPELECLFVDSVDIEPFIERNFDNVKSYGAAVTYQCHIVAKIEQVIQADGGDVLIATHQVILTDRFDIGTEDRITMPARFSITNPQIMAVKEWTDENGPHHTTVMVGPRKGARR